jgi:uncharacterized delta-60 repeat protein
VAIPGAFFTVLCIATQSSGGLIVGLDSSFGKYTNLCFRLNPNGSRDTTFTNIIKGSLNPRINSMSVQADGKILVGGFFSSVNGIARTNLARLNINGSLDSTFNAFFDSSSTVYKVAALTNGLIMAAGSFSTYGAVSRRGIIRINSDGSLDQTFGSGIGPGLTIFDFAPLPGSRWAVGGFFKDYAGVPRYNYAILDGSGRLITHLGFESFSVSNNNLVFGIMAEPDHPFQVLVSSNFSSWELVSSYLMRQNFTNLVLPKPLHEPGFFKLLQTY